jgi:hypothetical protein
VDGSDGRGCNRWTALQGELTRTSPAPARVARIPRHCTPMHICTRTSSQRSERPACARTHCLICTLSTLFTYALTGHTRMHCHLRQPLREHAEQAGGPCGGWVRLTPSSAPSAGVSGGPPIEILHLFFVFSTCTRGGSDRSHPSLLTDDYYFELPAHAQVPRRLPRRRSRRAAAHRRATRRLLARGLPREPQRHLRLRDRRCWRPAEAARTGAAAAGGAPGSGLMDTGPPAARVARAGT